MPSYLERFGKPEHSDDLLNHRCISNRLGDDRVYRWELERNGQGAQITVPTSVTVDQAVTGLIAVLGADLMYFPAPPSAYGMGSFSNSTSKGASRPSGYGPNKMT